MNYLISYKRVECYFFNNIFLKIYILVICNIDIYIYYIERGGYSIIYFNYVFVFYGYYLFCIGFGVRLFVFEFEFYNLLFI